MKRATKAARETEQKLRAERVRLIRAKVEESGGDIKGLTEAGMYFEFKNGENFNFSMGNIRK